MTRRTLLLGYGNPDRQDDGVAWHVLREVCMCLGLPAPDTFDEAFPFSSDFACEFALQLTPEMAEVLASYDRVCFIDAHTGQIPEEVRLMDVEPVFQKSPFTHHLTASSLLAMEKALYGHTIEAVLLSVRGYAFGFEQSLSPDTQRLLPQATTLIENWLKS